MRAKPDGLTPVALRAKRPLIAPSRPSSSRLTLRETSSNFAVGPIGHIGRIGLRLHRSRTAPSAVAPQGRSVLRSRGRFGASRLHAPFSVLRGAPAPRPQSMACEARHAPTGPSGRTCALRARTARPCVLVGTSQTCRGCREGALCAPENGEQKTENRTRGKRDRQTTVREGVQGELLPAGAWGSAPHLPINQSPNHPKSLCVLRVLCDFQSFWQFFVYLCVLRVLCDSRAALIFHIFPATPPIAPQGRSVLCGRGRFAASPLHAPFSVLRGGGHRLPSLLLYLWP